MKLFKHTGFLKTVLLYSLTAFGGPQGHLGMMLKIFVQKSGYITEEELIEYNSFCSLLPGASSTQTLTLIGYKRGGVLLAVCTLIIWILPACILMSAFSFLLTLFPTKNYSQNLFKFLEPMVIGFLLFSIVKAFKVSISNLITKIILTISLFVTFIFFKSPWVFPILIIGAGIATSLSSRRIPEKEVIKPREIKWTNIWLFAIIFIVAGTLSETAREKKWGNRKAYNLFENFYRFGSLVFGGGDVLLPMMIDQYVERPNNKNSDDEFKIDINKDDLLTGYGFVRAIPGPVFSVASFAGGMAMKEKGTGDQLLGCLIGMVGIFLPSALLVLFFFPVWQYLKKFVVIYRALEGINAVVVGVMCAAALYLFQVNFIQSLNLSFILSGVVIVFTFLMLRYTKLPTPIIALVCVILGWVF